MRFAVTATQQADGTITATLYESSELIASKEGFKTTRSVDRWAKGVAADHKRENLPDSSKSLSYSHNFSL